MKGKLLIEPGFKAGSLYCGECNLIYDMMCCSNWNHAFYFKGKAVNQDEDGEFLRCQQCLDAEVKDEN